MFRELSFCVATRPLTTDEISSRTFFKFYKLKNIDGLKTVINN